MSDDEVPSVAGVRVRPGLTLLLYVLLAGSAAAALWVQSGAAGAPDEARKAAAWVFLVFAVGFGVYRLALVAAKKYSAGKAFFQLGVAALFCMVLFLNRVEQPARAGAGGAGPAAAASLDDVAGLLSDPNPTVRALAAEVVPARADASRWAPALARALRDTDARVRERAHHALVELNAGEDLGPPEDASAVAAWKAKFP